MYRQTCRLIRRNLTSAGLVNRNVRPEAIVCTSDLSRAVKRSPFGRHEALIVGLRNSELPMDYCGAERCSILS